MMVFISKWRLGLYDYPTINVGMYRLANESVILFSSVKASLESLAISIFCPIVKNIEYQLSVISNK